eukprot:scaffold89720_cov64-Phaeocystis_antarctica.AAC.5
MSSTPRQLTHAAICCLPTLLPDAAAASDAPACDAKSSATAQQPFSCNGAVAHKVPCVDQGAVIRQLTGALIKTAAWSAMHWWLG